MKKTYYFIFVAILSLPCFSQIEKGSVQLETGFSAFSSSDNLYGSNITGFSFVSSGGNTYWSVGLEAGYFVLDNLAVKFGFGRYYENGNSSSSFKLGAKHYFKNFPTQLDLTAALNEDRFLQPKNNDPIWLSLQQGYALWLNEKVVFEPTVRYSVLVNNTKETLQSGYAFGSKFAEPGLFQLNFFFSILI